MWTLKKSLIKFILNHRECFMKIIFLLLLSIFFENAAAQTDTDINIDTAFNFAKKGVYWALTNIPEKKSKIENDLIANDKLIATVKLSKEVNGVKIESTGFYFSNEITIKIFKSFDNLIKEGYIKEANGESGKIKNE